MTDSTKTVEPSELTVVVTARNRAYIIDETLAALAAQCWDGAWDIVLLDNDSTDQTPDLLERWVHKMPVPARVVRATERHNPSYARNAGVAATDAASVAFIDDDDIVAVGWVAAIGTALRTNEFVASRHEYRRLNDEATARERRGQTERLNRLGRTAVASSAGLGCRRRLWIDVGQSNEAFRTGQDIDFSLRVARLGVTPHFCRDAEYSMRMRPGIAGAFSQGERMGRALVHLVAVHGDDHGVERASTRRWARRWLALALRVRTLRDAANRRRWAHDIGHELGRLRGCMVYRIWFP